MLKGYGVRPEQIRVADASFKGYRRVDFFDAWSRYVHTPPLSETRETRETFSVPKHEQPPEKVSDVSDVSPNQGVQAQTNGACRPGLLFDREGAGVYAMSAAELLDFPLLPGFRIGPGRAAYHLRLPHLTDGEMAALVDHLESTVGDSRLYLV